MRNLASINTIPLADSATKVPGLIERCHQFTRSQELIAAGMYPYFHVIESAQEPEVICDGREMIMMSSNNYLGLTNHPKVVEASIKAIRKYGTGCAGSPFLNGRLDIHEKLESRLAEFVGKPAAIIFPTGYQANAGAISALTGKHDLIVSDKMNHASIFDGCRLSYSQVRKFRHNDIQHLEQILHDNPDRNSLVVVDGVYSMEGDIVDLPGLVEICSRYRATVMLDDAHGIGVLGEYGRGTCNHFGLTDGVDLIMLTFSKSLATIGGALIGDASVIDYLKHHARPLIFSASLPAAQVAAANAALEIMLEEPERKEQLWRNARQLQQGFKSIGFNVGPTQTPIVPIVVGEEETVLMMWRKLFDKGVFASPVFSPGVPPGKALIRTSCMATHTESQIDRVLEIFDQVGRTLGLC